MNFLFIGFAFITLNVFQMELDRKLERAQPDSFLLAKLNGCELYLPSITIRTMIHCVHGIDRGSVILYVETAHSDWMRDRLISGGLFIDVGAATGTMSLPFAKMKGVEIVAYEPCALNRDLLERALQKNGIEHVMVKPVAVSDQPGEVCFREFDHDVTRQIPFMNEVASIVHDQISTQSHRDYLVRTVTLDEDLTLILKESHKNKVVVKIDVEGFEAKVLQGAQRLIAEYRPYFAIDIHANPFGEGTTEADVKSLLPNYLFEKVGHVLLCTPKTRVI